MIELQKAALGAAITAFAKKKGSGARPPPLHGRAGGGGNSTPEDKDAAAPLASGSVATDSTESWREGEVVTARSFCSYLRAQDEYRGQLVSVTTMPARGVLTCTLTRNPHPNLNRHPNPDPNLDLSPSRR